MKIAKELGVTQAMVSKYLSKYNPPEILNQIMEEIDTLAVLVAEMIKNDTKKRK